MQFFFNCDYSDIITRLKKDYPIGYVSDAQYEEGMAQVRSIGLLHEKTGEAVPRVSRKTTLFGQYDKIFCKYVLFLHLQCSMNL